MFSNFRRVLATLLLATLLLLSACDSAPSRFDQAQQESTQRGADAVSKEAVAGGSFNKFFPRSSDGFQLVFAQEKKGSSLAKLKQNGKEVAMLSITDTVSNPSAAQKYQQSSEKLNGYPLIEQGSKTTALLVDNRFQVKVTSRSDSFSPSDRRQWLQKFDLNGVAQLK